MDNHLGHMTLLVSLRKNRERAIKVGWPTVKVPSVMVWGLHVSPLSYYISGRHYGG